MAVELAIRKQISGDRLVKLNDKLSDIITKALDAKSMRGQRVEQVVWEMHGPYDVAANFRFSKIQLHVLSVRFRVSQIWKTGLNKFKKTKNRFPKNTSSRDGFPFIIFYI